MGKRGHLLPSGNVAKCFCALVVTTEHSVDELFLYYFHNLSSASEDKAPDRDRGSIPGPRWGTPNLSTPRKILRATMHMP